MNFENPAMVMERRRRVLGLGIGASLVAVVGARAFTSDAPPPGRDTDVGSLEICTTSGVKRIEDPAGEPDRRIAVIVPMQTPKIGEPGRESVRVEKNEIIEFIVTSNRPGSVAVHGLLENRPVVVGSEMRAPVKAIYTGRFPLHFHGADGSHFEIAAMEVHPSPK